LLGSARPSVASILLVPNVFHSAELQMPSALLFRRFFNDAFSIQTVKRRRITDDDDELEVICKKAVSDPISEFTWRD
jgi:hypothetical protein